MKNILKFYALPLLVILNACDIIEQDYAPEPISDLEPGITEVQARPQSVLLINVLQQLKVNEPVRLSFSQMPTRGQVQFIDLGLIQYQSEPSFVSGQDRFVYKVTSNSNQTLLQDTVVINMTSETDTISCGAYYDYQQLQMNAETVIDVLANDNLCGVEKESVTLKISQHPTNGTATIANNQLIYQPYQDFTGSDQVIYEICLSNEGDTCYWAKVDLEVVSDNCETFLKPDSIVYYYNHSDTLFYNLLANDFICDSAAVTQELLNVPAGNLAFIHNQEMVYYPEQDGFEQIQFDYKVCDPYFNCYTDKVIISFADSARAPACEVNLQNDNYDFRSDSTTTASYKLQVLANDQTCADDYLLKIGQAPTQGSVTVHSSYLEFKPEENQEGNVVFSYQVCIGNACYSAEVMINL